METIEDGELIPGPSLQEIISGPRLIFGPFPTEWFENREEIETIMCRPDGFTGQIMRVDIKKLRAGDPEVMHNAETIIAAYRINNTIARFYQNKNFHEAMTLLNQLCELLTSLEEGSKKAVRIVK